mmetsp:Transcript_15228/g.18473  ORF Transcript_15228/g.18473 Transcript_15228/m.18473 type:complete len:111 (-) Transcript_15228:740-1072(-)
MGTKILTCTLQAKQMTLYQFMETKHTRQKSLLHQLFESLLLKGCNLFNALITFAVSDMFSTAANIWSVFIAAQWCSSPGEQLRSFMQSSKVPLRRVFEKLFIKATLIRIR